jgi:Ca2+-binding RTX toxin-like protein
LAGVALAATIQGTGTDDVLTGTESSDVIIPFDGNDTTYANGGDDEVCHSSGNDLIYGSAGADTLRGGRGEDVIYGGPERDLIDCAYKATHSGDSADTAFYNPNEDTVVDCKTRNPWGPTLLAPLRPRRAVRGPTHQ